MASTAKTSLFNGRSGALTGLLYTTNGGQTWSALGQNSAFAGESVKRNGARQYHPRRDLRTDPSEIRDRGLRACLTGGINLHGYLRAAGSGLPAGAVTSLVADPSNPSTFYAAVKNGANKGATAVYVSHDMGATWTSVFTAANSNGAITTTGDQTVITLAAGPNGSVAVAVSDLGILARSPRWSAYTSCRTRARTGICRPQPPTSLPADRRRSTCISRSIRTTRISVIPPATPIRLVPVLGAGVPPQL